MTQVRTDYGDTRESARRERFEKTGSITNATNVQTAIQAAAGFSTGNAAVSAPPQNATITATSANVGIEIDTSGGAVTLNLPGVSAWRLANPGALEFWFLDKTGQGAANNITPALNGGDVFVSGVVPKVRSPFGIVRLRPNTALTGWNAA
jgi:hypothetical protein